MKLGLIHVALMLFWGSIQLGIPEAFAADLEGVTEKFAKQANISQEKAKNEVEILFQLLAEEMKLGKEIQVRNFGESFYLQKREAREDETPERVGKFKFPQDPIQGFAPLTTLKN